MRVQSDDRGVTTLVGLSILLAFLVLFLAYYQTTAVPGENEEIEFDHNQHVQDELLDLRNALLRTAATGDERSVSIKLGTTYPARIFFVNPPDATGELRTAEVATGRITIRNATADGETGDYWTGTERVFETRVLVYAPFYNVYDQAPRTIYEHTLLYNQFENANLTIAEQTLITGDQITIVTLTGSLSTSTSGPASIDPKVISGPYTPITIQNETDPITITLPTTQPNSTIWEETLLAGESRVRDVNRVGPNLIRIVLEPGTYQLQMAKIGLTSMEEPPHYLTLINGVNRVDPTDTEEIVVEVRDRFNNPVVGVPVNVSEVSGGTITPSENKISNAEGRAIFEYTAPPRSGTQTVTFNISDTPVTPREEITVSITVQGTPTVVTLLDESFESGSVPSGWNQNDMAGVNQGDSVSGIYSAFVGGPGQDHSISTPPLNTSGSHYLSIDYWVAEDRPEADENDEGLVVEYQAENGSWVALESVAVVEPETEYNRQMFLVDSSAQHDSFRLRFRMASADENNDQWRIDDVRVFCIGETNACGQNT